PTTVDDHVWYQLEGEAGFGWVAASTFGPSNAASPAGKFKFGEELVMNTDVINIRETPSLKGLISATLPYMAKAVVVSGPMPANGYKWYQVTTDYGAGWSVEQYLAREGEVTPPTRFVVGDAVQVGDPEGIRLRSGSSSQSTPIASLSPGVRGVVIEGPTAADGFVWLKIQTSQGSGWCAEEFLDEAPSADPPAARFGLGDRVLVDTDSLNLRESPGATAPIVVSLGTGVSANVVGGPETANNMNWYQLETDYGTGWSVEQFLTKEDAASTSRVFSPGSRVYVNTDSLNLRSSPGIDSEVVAVLVTNDRGEIAGGPVEKDGFNWYQVRSDGGTGWGAAQYLGKGTADPFSEKTFSAGDTVYVDTDLLNIRAEASLSATIVTTLGIDESATVSDRPVEADGFGWVNVTSPKGAGWCVADYLAKVSGNGPRIGDTARVFDGELNLRVATSVGSDVIALIPDAAYVEVLEGPVGAESYDWYRVSTSRFGTGWCAGQWLAVV
ncbi:MAG TPA: SH3 domain-containing protein, partial [Thermomicrobiales bacterium]|nr:SH3 domain-containing protein [Thermomicrobiales bacterium]